MKRRPVACRVVLERLSASIDGDLPAADCRRLETHARTCPRCATVMAELRTTIDACRRAAGTPLPPAVRRTARDRVRKLMR